jgi:hypothetical protein
MDVFDRNYIHIKFLHQSIFHYLCINLFFNLPLWSVKKNVIIITIVCLMKCEYNYYCLSDEM